MTQPQQPFGEARCTDAREPAVPYQQPVVGRVAYAPDANRQRIPDGSAFPPPLRETADPVDAAELLKRQAAQIGALQVRVGVQDARIAALDDDCRRLRAEVERLGKAQAI